MSTEIVILNLLESESNRDDETDKYNRVDLHAVDERGDHLIIEIQNDREVHYLERLLFGTSKRIVENLNLGEDYKKIKKVISVSILYFTLGDKVNDYVYKGTTKFRGHSYQHPPFAEKEGGKSL